MIKRVSPQVRALTSMALLLSVWSRSSPDNEANEQVQRWPAVRIWWLLTTHRWIGMNCWTFPAKAVTTCSLSSQAELFQHFVPNRKIKTTVWNKHPQNNLRINIWPSIKSFFCLASWGLFHCEIHFKSAGSSSNGRRPPLTLNSHSICPTNPGSYWDFKICLY